MNIRALAIAVLALSRFAHATQITPTPLPELVAKSDYVLIGKVVKVDIINEDGHEFNDLKARTGPGIGNVIRLHVAVDRSTVLKGNPKKLPKRIIVPEWSRWHMTLGIKRERAEGKKFVFLLSGKDFAPVSAPESVRELSEREAIEKLLKE